MEAIVLKCKNCGGNLNVAADAKTVQCRYCNAQHQIIREQDGSVDYKMLEAGVQQLIDKENAKLRIPELRSKRSELLDKINEATATARKIEDEYNRPELLVGLLALCFSIGVLFKGETQSTRFWGFIAAFPIGLILTGHVFSEKRKLRAEANKYRHARSQYRTEVAELEEEMACLQRILDSPIASGYSNIPN